MSAVPCLRRSARIAAAAAVASPFGLAAQVACANGLVSEIEVVNHSIFDEQEITSGRLAFARVWANRLHFRTREGLIRGKITLAEGACFDARDSEDSERLLRDLRFIARARVNTEQLGDGNWRVRVETWDEWTTRGGVALSVEDRLRIEGGFFVETNLLGTGTTLALKYDRAEEARDYTVRLASSQLVSGPLDGSVTAGRTRNGWVFENRLEHPFRGEQGRFEGEFHIELEDDLQRYSTGMRDGITDVLLPLANRQGHVWMSKRFGVPGKLFSLGGEIEINRHRVGGPTQVAVGNNFNELYPSPDSLAELLGRQATPPSWYGVGVRLGTRRLRFEKWRGVDLITGTQDVALGTELEVTLGRALGTWDTGPSDYYGLVRGFVSGAVGDFLAQATLEARGRRLDSEVDGSSWRDVLWTATTRLFYRPTPGSANSLSVWLDVNGGWHTQVPFQLTLGGTLGVRSLVKYDFPAARTLTVRLEEQWNPILFAPTAELGFTLFADIGRGWAGDVPFSIDSGWQHGVGVGMRWGFPAGTGSVLRIELAQPTSAGGNGSVFRMYWVHGSTGR